MNSAEGDGEQLRYVIRRVNDHTAIVVALPGHEAVARLSRKPDGHTSVVFWPMLSGRQRAWLYGRLLDYLDGGGGRCQDAPR